MTLSRRLQVTIGEPSPFHTGWLRCRSRRSPRRRAVDRAALRLNFFCLDTSEDVVLESLRSLDNLDFFVLEYYAQKAKKEIVL